MSHMLRRLEAERLHQLALNLSGTWKLEILLLLMEQPALTAAQITEQLGRESIHSTEVTLCRLRQAGLLDYALMPRDGRRGRKPRLYGVRGAVAQLLKLLRHYLALEGVQ